MSDVTLVVAGMRYGGWKSVRVTRSIESLAGSFDLDVSDGWGEQLEPIQIAEEDPCRVEIDGTVVIDGYVDVRDPSASDQSRVLSFSGRDRAAALVDCSCILGKWTYHDISLVDFVVLVAAPFGIRVSTQPGLQIPPVAKLVINPGDTAFEAIAKAAADAAVLVVSDGAGGLLITRHGTARASALVEGENIKSCSLKYDGTNRYYRYEIVSQAAGTDEAYGEATRVKASAIDEGVRRKDRVLLIRPDKGYSVADARRRVDWEARIRAAKAETATVTVRGWKQPSGGLWPVNAITHVQASRLIGVDGDMLISQVDYSIGDGGEITQLRLVRPDAFTPEPQLALVKSSGGAWKELNRGAL